MDHAASRLPHRLAPALALGLAFLPLASRADIAGYPEASEEVRVYRALEKQFMARDEAKEMFRFVPGTNCPHSESPLPPQASWEISIISSDSPSPPFKVRTYTRCGIDVATLCAEGRVAMDVFSDGRWAWTMSRIGYIKYYRDLSKRVGLPDSVIGTELSAMEKMTMDNISRRLKRPKGLQNFDGEIGGMGYANDLRFDNDRVAALESAMALKWDRHLSTLPKSQQQAVPAFFYMPECGAGEQSFVVKSDPPGAKIRIISDFDWLLCREIGRDPWDPNDCLGWSLIVKKENSLIGRYRYQAEWRNGKISKDVIEVEQFYGNPKDAVLTFR